MKLSFCIPTYERRGFLEETLNSIFSQLQEGVEVVISDNHSMDDTESYVRGLQALYPCVHYHRWEDSVECGKNLLKAVELAKGEYCWLMTDDDRVEEGGVQHVLSLLKNYPSLTGISVNVEGYDCLLKGKKKIRYSHKIRTAKLFNNAEEVFEELGAWFGFWSAQIVHRKKWEETISDHTHVSFLGYHHLYLILKMVKEAPRWFFTDKKCVGYRSNNESFVREYGRLKRFEIDAFSYTTIGLKFFKKSSVKKVNTLVLNQLLFWQLVTVKCEGVSFLLLKNLLKISFKYYKTHWSFWYKFVPLMMFPTSILKIIRSIKKFFFIREDKTRESRA